MKVLVRSGDTDQSNKDLIGYKVLRYGWDSSDDMMTVKFPINVSKKKGKKLRSLPDLTTESFHLLSSTVLTKRICLGVAHTFVDFLGLACPFTL